MKKIVFAFACFVLFCFHEVSAQLQFLPLAHEYTALYEKDIHASSFHTAVKPFFQEQIIAIADSINNTFSYDPYGDGYTKDLSWFKKKLFLEPFFHLKGDNYDVSLNPLINLSLGRDGLKDGLLYNNTRGVQVQGALGKGFKFYSDFFENQTRFAQYIDDKIIENRVVPGSVVPKPFKTDAYDYFFANGFISYSTRDNIFNFQFGRGKIFIGDGYRSTILSDNAYSYPFLKITTNFWKIQYVNIFTKMTDISDINPINGLFVPKYTSIHNLSVNITDRINVSFFEATTFQDSLRTRGYDIDFLNPIIFYRAVESHGGRFDIANSMLGASVKFTPTKNSMLYGQFFLDEFNINKLREDKGWWGNKYGIQVGGKMFDLFIENLTLQLEFNSVRPYTYSHFNVYQNYAHYNAPLAHPLGANFNEFGMFLFYRKNRIGTNFKVLVHKKGIDPIGENWGGDVYKSYEEREVEFGNVIGQGIEQNVLYSDLNIYYLLNPNYNLRINLNLAYRNDSLNENTGFVMFGISSNLINSYIDL